MLFIIQADGFRPALLLLCALLVYKYQVLQGKQRLEPIQMQLENAATVLINVMCAERLHTHIS